MPSSEDPPGLRSLPPVRIFVTRAFRAALLCGAVMGMAAAGTTPVQATDQQPRASVTSKGGTLTVTPVRGLDPAGATLRVKGRGFDPTIGIYVALCVTPRRGQVPSPCGGGVNTSGQNPASAWISSNPPPYGTSLATAFRKGGRFSVVLQVSALIGDVDCRTVSCSIVTRADHTHPGDRRSDVSVPVMFRP